MAFGEIGFAKQIALNAPKYKNIIEPFGDNGTLALYLGKKKPQQHTVNIEDETMFTIMSFIQTLSAADKKRLKGFDWVGSLETFDQVVAITAIEGAELFYRYFYLNKFAAKSKDPEAPPAFDYLKLNQDYKNMLYGLPTMRVGLKPVTLTNEDPLTVMGTGSAGAFSVLLPKKPEHIDAVESRLGNFSGEFFYAKKSTSNDDLFESVAINGDSMNISTFAASSIMMAQFEVRTNYDSKMSALEPIEQK